MAERNSANAKRFRKVIARQRPACHICGLEIQWDAPYLDPLSFVIDHVKPLHKGGEDALHNIKAAHRRQTSMQLQEACTPIRTNHSTLWVALVSTKTQGGATPRLYGKSLRG